MMEMKKSALIASILIATFAMTTLIMDGSLVSLRKHNQQRIKLDANTIKSIRNYRIPFDVTGRLKGEFYNLLIVRDKICLRRRGNDLLSMECRKTGYVTFEWSSPDKPYLYIKYEDKYLYVDKAENGQVVKLGTSPFEWLPIQRAGSYRFSFAVVTQDMKNGISTVPKVIDAGARELGKVIVWSINDGDHQKFNILVSKFVQKSEVEWNCCFQELVQYV